jgi:hypothetical protein
LLLAILLGQSVVDFETDIYSLLIKDQIFSEFIKFVWENWKLKQKGGSANFFIPLIKIKICFIQIGILGGH